jgi:hypothetical protein
MSPQRSSPLVRLKSEAQRRLKPLMDRGLVTDVRTERSGSSLWIAIAVSVQTKVLAPDYDAAQCEDALQKLKDALGDLPFRVVTRPAQDDKSTDRPTDS